MYWYLLAFCILSLICTPTLFFSFLLVLVVCIATASATEVTSNVACCSILLPVLKNLAVSLRIHPLYLLLPVTLSCSYAFMLPVATPPNAIVYSASGMKTSEMVRQSLQRVCKTRKYQVPNFPNFT